ncbi:DNA-binding response regulator [Streptomyces sp. NPDC059215]|uniref:helix-turn-helix transcriptional regulator n=1 Tax=Streptomyces sp. NPDC059215 TaxID=3346772 RepID=UPI0036A973EF
MAEKISVAVHADEQLTLEGTIAALREYPGMEIFGISEAASAEVLLLIVRTASGETISQLEKVAIRKPDIRTVIVADSIPEALLLRAVGLGAAGYLNRTEAAFSDVVDAISTVQRGNAEFPKELLPTLLQYIQRLERREPGGGLGLDSRDIIVLAHLAKGADTSRIARKLNYSDRTIKAIIHRIMQNLGVRNRTEAVAYVIKAGLL